MSDEAIAKPEPPKCETCAYWQPANRKLGSCQIRSPHIVEVDDGWPIVKATEWCGEHSEFSDYLAARALWREQEKKEGI